MTDAATEFKKATGKDLPAHVEVDQETKAPEIDDDPETRQVPEEPATTARVDSMAAVSDGTIGYIKNLQGGVIYLKAQPGGVWTAITQVFNNALGELAEQIDVNTLASMTMLSQVGDTDTETARKLKEGALENILKEALPKLLNTIAQKIPDTLAEIVALILEPNPDKIRNKQDLTYSTEQVLWEISIPQQIEAVLIFVESLRLDDLRKKVLGFLKQ